jgi:hypothetical protein
MFVLAFVFDAFVFFGSSFEHAPSAETVIAMAIMHAVARGLLR